MNIENPRITVNLSFRAFDLLDKDVLSKSDPSVWVFLKDESTGKYVFIAQTETLKDNLNPEFKTCIPLEYYFEQQQNLLFEVYDMDNESKNPAEHDLLGQYFTTLANVVRCGKKSVEVPLILKGKKIKSRIIVNAEEVKYGKELVVLDISASKLACKNFFGLGSSDPFLEIYREGNDEKIPWVQVHQTEYKPKNVNPQWETIRLTGTQLCNTDYEKKIKFECYDWEKSGKHRFIGSVEIQAKHLKGQFSLGLMDKNKPAGQLQVRAVTENNYTWLDYIFGGMEISLMVAIDFTASNGDPDSPTSLHYKGAVNPYQKAISAVGSIVLQYDTDGKIPAYWFGGKLPHEVSVRHCYPLTGADPEVSGMQGLLDNYCLALNNTTLYGPTYFSHVISKAVSATVDWTESQQKYTVLLIITDGAIGDMQDTIYQISRASQTPLSIIIIGVGNADFSQMEELDGDGRRLGNSMRDIVQFVPFNRYENNMGALTNAVLGEIPKQVQDYARLKGMKPLDLPRL